MFKAGDKVIFGRTHGEQTRGTVVKVNRTTVLVEQDEERGVNRVRSVGTKWKVPFNLCRLVNGPAANTNAVVAAPAAKRSEREIMRDLLNAYSMLSPENLTCDGELRGSMVVARAKALRARIIKLQAELGRKVSEDECFRWSMVNR